MFADRSRQAPWYDMGGSSDEIAREIKFSRALIRKDARYHCQMCRFRTLRPDIATKVFTNKLESLFQNFNKPGDKHPCIFFQILSSI